MGDFSAEAGVEAAGTVGGGGWGATVARPVPNKNSILNNSLLRLSEPEESTSAATQPIQPILLAQAVRVRKCTRAKPVEIEASFLSDPLLRAREDNNCCYPANPFWMGKEREKQPRASQLYTLTEIAELTTCWCRRLLSWGWSRDCQHGWWRWLRCNGGWTCWETDIHPE